MAGFYSEELIEEIRERNNIVDVISSYVSLKKKGGNYFGLCPFHSEKSASFSVSPSKNMYYCFGCQRGGNVISFIMEYENVTFPEALSILAERAGIALPRMERTEEEKKKADLKEQILAVNKEAGRYYYYQLTEPSGERALSYLKGRGLSEKTIKAFGLGYARTGTNLLYRYLRSKGFEDELLKKSGIFVSDEKSGMRDKFWNRVIFPIMDLRNRIIGFGGRVMGEGEPKYLNSPETEVFDKGRNLYGLNIAKSSRKKELLICEGYMDVISLHQAGFAQATASLGTSFTEAQARLLGRFCEEVLLCYDSDGAGVNAALRAIGILRGIGLGCRVIDLRPYKDPDEFIKGLGAEEFEKRLENAENSFLYEIRIEEGKHDLKDPEDKTKFLREAAKKLLVFEDAIERDSYIETLSGKYGVSREGLSELVRKQAMLGEDIKAYERPKPPASKRQKETKDSCESAQKQLIAWILEEPVLIDVVLKETELSDFSEGVIRGTAELLFSQIREGKPDPASIIDRYQNEEDRREVSSILQDMQRVPEDKDKDRVLKELILKILEGSASRFAKEAAFGDVAAMQEMLEKKRLLEKKKKDYAKERLL
ncbi:MAG: DNA primase [Lachnospiraceae bacterium]|nr:DNA primase [Lachnospiraceae bacterium]